MSSSCNKDGVRMGAWSDEEDQILADFISLHGVHGWSGLPLRAGLKRSAKSCRLRWLNYLRPDLIRGNITQDEEALIVRFHKLLGNRWSLIAGKLPGRSDSEIKNYWNTKLKKKVDNGEYDDIQVNPSRQDQTKKKGSSSFPTVVAAIRPKATKCTKLYIDPLCTSTMSTPPIASSKLHAFASTSMVNDNLSSEAFEKQYSWGFEYNMDDHEIAQFFQDFDI